MMKYLIVLAVITVAVGVFVHQGNQFWWNEPVEGAAPVVFVIPEGERFQGIAFMLHEAQFIKSRFWFKVYAKIAGSARTLQAGSFELTPGMSYAAIVAILSNGASEEVVITIPEGYTLKQIGEVVTANLNISTTDWALATGLESPLEDHPFVVGAQKPENVDLEGYLFPDTYHFFADATAVEVATVMLEEMEENIQVASDQVVELSSGQGDYTTHELLTFASIIEREVRHQEDMATVAGLFYNRLEIGMALQADSTVNYFTGKDTPSVSLSDTEIDSPYNTYLYAGLPPGPISNPGLNALRAVFEPTENDYLYFLTSPEGVVYYGRTFDEHIQNRELYLR